MQTVVTLAIIGSSLLLHGCASTYGNLVSGSNLGAQEYTPAVLKNPGMESKYAEILGVCRQVATSRQITAAQEAQLATVTGVVQGGVHGAVAGLQVGSLFKQAGLGGGVNRSMGVGMLSGLASSMASSFASGTLNDAEQTKVVLLSCLRKADPQEKFYKVIE